MSKRATVLYGRRAALALCLAAPLGCGGGGAVSGRSGAQDVVPDPSTTGGTAPAAVRCGPSAALRGWSFDEGLGGWSAEGGAFAGQPTLGDTVPPLRPDRGVPGFRPAIQGEIGGDYWDTPIDVGRVGAGWIGTYEGGRGDGATGALRSPPFILDSEHVTFLLGGGAGVSGVRVELQILESQRCFTVPDPLGGGHSACAPALGRDGAYLIVAATSPVESSEVMRRLSFHVGGLRGLTARLRVVDEAAGGWGHVNFDDVQCQDELEQASLGDGPAAELPPFDAPPLPGAGDGTKDKLGTGKPDPNQGAAATIIPIRATIRGNAPLWGIADVHAHLMMHLAFDGQLLLMNPTASMEALLSDCGGDHAGNVKGGAPPHEHGAIVDPLIWDEVLCGFERGDLNRSDHIRTIGSASHQQVTLEMLERAHRGGLRLLTLQATHNQAIEGVLVGSVHNSRPDHDVVQAQILAARRLFPDAQRFPDDPSDESDPRVRPFARIVYSPAQARSAIAQGLLAIVLGVETSDHAIDAHSAPSGVAGAESEPVLAVRRYHALGVRQVTPVHAVDNQVGGAALFQDQYQSANVIYNGRAFEPLYGPLERSLVGRPLSEVSYSLPNPPGICGGVTGALLALDRDIDHRFPDWCIDVSVNYGYGAAPGHHANARGLLDYGRRFLGEMMARGMIIDTDHMGRLNRESVFGELLGPDTALPYPALSSHSDFSALTPGRESEERRTPQELQWLRNGGGMVAPITNAWARRSDMIDEASVGNIAFPLCAGSSTEYAARLRYAVARMGGRGVALGSDWNGMNSKPNSRFGTTATVDPSAPQWRAVDAIPSLACNGSGAQAQVQRALQNGVCYDDYGGCGGATTVTRRYVQVQKEDGCAVVGASGPASCDWEDEEGAVLTRALTVPLAQGNPARPLVRFRPAGVSDEVRRTRAGFDINTDGLLHMGLLPDFLQDLRNVGVSPAELGTLLRSAEDYVRMWERAEAFARRAAPAPVVLLDPVLRAVGSACKPLGYDATVSGYAGRPGLRAVIEARCDPAEPFRPVGQAISAGPPVFVDGQDVYPMHGVVRFGPSMWAWPADAPHCELRARDDDGTELGWNLDSQFYWCSLLNPGRAFSDCRMSGAASLYYEKCFSGK